MKDWGRLFYILIGNWVGVMAMTLIVAVSSEGVVAQANEVVSKIIADRTTVEWWRILVRAIGTGFIMEIAVRYGRDNKWMTVVLGVDNDLSGGELCKQPFPNIVRNR